MLSVSLVNAHLDWPVAQSRGDGKKKTSNCAGIYYFIYEKIVAFAKMSMKILSHLRSRSRSKSSVR